MHLAAYAGNSEVVKLLLEAGANKDVVNDDGDTALHWAAFEGHSNVVKLILETGVYKDVADSTI